MYAPVQFILTLTQRLSWRLYTIKSINLMIIFASKDLDKHGISHQSTNQLLFKGHIFTKGQTFAAHLRKAAFELAQENLTLGQPCIVIDYNSHVTLWRVPRSSAKIADRASSVRKKRSKTKADATTVGKLGKRDRSRRVRSTPMGSE